MFIALIKKKEDKFEALCTQLNVTSKGSTIEDTIDKLRDKINFQFQKKDIGECIESKEVFITKFTVNKT